MVVMIVVIVQNSGISSVWISVVAPATIAEVVAAVVILRRDARRFASKGRRRRRRGSNDVPSAVDVVFVAMIVTLAARINKAMILAASPALVQQRRNKAGQVARHDDYEEDAASAMTVVAVAVAVAAVAATTAPQAPPSPSRGGSLSLSLARKRGRRDAGRRGLDRRFACSWRR
jgi:malic enzyme